MDKKNLDDIMDLFHENVTPEDIMEAKLTSEITALIIKERLKRGLNQKQFAELLGVSQPVVSKWESGGYNFTIRKLAEIMARLNLDISFSAKGASGEKTETAGIVSFTSSHAWKSAQYVNAPSGYLMEE